MTIETESSGKPQEIKRCDKCQDHHAGRPALCLGWPGERKSIGATSRSNRRFSKSPGEHRAKKSVDATRQGYGVRQLQGPEPAGRWAWGRHTGLDLNWVGAASLRVGRGPRLGLGGPVTGACGPGPQAQWPKTELFRRSEKSPGRGLAKGWESAETAAADVGVWREAGTGYRPPPPFLSVTDASKVGGP